MLGVGLETYKSYNLSYDPLKKVTKITKRWHEALAFKFTSIFCRHEALAFKSTSIFSLLSAYRSARVIVAIAPSARSRYGKLHTSAVAGITP